MIDKGEISTEILRKSIHMLIALVPLLAGLNLQLTLVMLAAGVLFYTWSEVQRLHGRPVFLISTITTHAARVRDRDRFVLGPITLGLGAMLALFLYPQPAAAMAVYALAFGDGLAALVGKMFGRISIPHTGGKTIIGSLACFATVLALALGIVHEPREAVLIALAATGLELFPTKDMDNIILPVGVGLLTMLLML